MPPRKLDVYVCMYIHIYIYTRTHTAIYRYICIHTHIYIQIPRYVHAERLDAAPIKQEWDILKEHSENKKEFLPIKNI